MTDFKKILTGEAFHGPIESPSVSVKLAQTGHIFSLRFGARETITEVGYEGGADPLLSSLCALVINKDLTEAYGLQRRHWKQTFGQELKFWDLWGHQEEKTFFRPLELLRAAIDLFQGRAWPYQEASPLICRCFGVREADVINYVNTEQNPTLEGLAIKSKATMGCRSCLPQLERLLKKATTQRRYYKERSYAYWLELIDEKLKEFPASGSWQMEVGGMKGHTVIITYEHACTQREEEQMGSELQRFLAAGVDSDLSFFLRRSRQR